MMFNLELNPFMKFKTASYYKFDFIENKYQLIKEGELDKYVLFSNNAVESFKHLINQCLDQII